mmetsp:Transcript_71564/g.158090  ORF Transcript_71564/g.158090 Transcript_71564/m.158090 type:complete len:83 (+) Transcript_71564:999-1247(+)
MPFAIRATRSAGDCERRLPALDVDCTEDDRFKLHGRKAKGLVGALRDPGSPPSSLLSSERSCSWRCNWAALASIGLLTRENW